MSSTREKEKSLQWYYAHREQCLKRGKAYREKHREYFNKNAIKQTRKRKVEVLQHYSISNTAHCSRCGIDDIDVLCLDHIHGGGTRERQRLKLELGGSSLYSWLRKQGYPKGYQTLCANCNLKKKIQEKEIGKK